MEMAFGDQDEDEDWHHSLRSSEHSAAGPTRRKTGKDKHELTAQRSAETERDWLSSTRGKESVNLLSKSSRTAEAQAPKGQENFSSKFQNMCKSLFGGGSMIAGSTSPLATKKKPPTKLQNHDSSHQQKGNQQRDPRSKQASEFPKLTNGFA